MKTTFLKSAVKGIAAAIPSQSIELTALSTLFGNEEVKRIMASTGIERIRVAPAGQCASDLCQTAAEELLARLEVDPKSIDGIIFVSQTPDYKMPATSALLQHRLGMPTAACAFDINFGCSGFVYGLYQAGMMIEAGGCERVLVLAGDTSTRLVHPQDRSVRMVFGDAGSAALVEKGESISHFILRTDGSGADSLIIPAGGARMPFSEETSLPIELEDGNVRTEEHLKMDGMDIMSFALREVPQMVEELLKMAGWEKDEVGTFALHQANKFMLDYLRKKMKLKPDCLPIAVQNVGNTGPASIPLLLSLKHQQLIAENKLQKVVCCGFGVGLSWAACSLDLSSALIIDPIEI